MKTCRVTTFSPERDRECGAPATREIEFRDGQREAACRDCALKLEAMAPPGAIAKVGPLR